MPVIEEEVAAGVKAVKTGAVRVDKHVEKRIRKVEGPLLHEDVEVRRVPVNRVVTEAPPVRRKGDTVIVPGRGRGTGGHQAPGAEGRDPPHQAAHEGPVRQGSGTESGARGGASAGRGRAG